MLPAFLLDKLNVLFGWNDNEEIFEQKFGATIVTLYGEWFGEKIQSGWGYISGQNFIFFDVMVGDIWLERTSIEEVAQAFGISVVPIIIRGTIQEAVDYVKWKPLSTVAQNDTSLKSEWLVGVPLVWLQDRLWNRMIVKIKVRDFL